MKQMMKGFTLVEIMIVVAIIAILAAVAIPNFVKYRNDSLKSSCLSNMKQLQTAGEQWRIATQQADQNPTLANLCGGANYIKVTPVCPYKKDGEYTFENLDGDVLWVNCPNASTSACAEHTLPNKPTSAGTTST